MSLFGAGYSAEDFEKFTMTPQVRQQATLDLILLVLKDIRELLHASQTQTTQLQQEAPTGRECSPTGSGVAGVPERVSSPSEGPQRRKSQPASNNRNQR